MVGGLLDRLAVDGGSWSARAARGRRCCSGCASRCCGWGSSSGLVLRGEGGVMAVQMLVWPIGFLSNVFVSPEDMPAWLGFLAQWNPVSATAAACRELFGNPSGHHRRRPRRPRRRGRARVAAGAGRGLRPAVGARLPRLVRAALRPTTRDTATASALADLTARRRRTTTRRRRERLAGDQRLVGRGPRPGRPRSRRSVSAIRSETSSPASRRACWTARTRSRARPSAASSGVTAVSRTTNPPPRQHAESRCRRRRSRPRSRGCTPPRRAPARRRSRCRRRPPTSRRTSSP